MRYGSRKSVSSRVFSSVIRGMDTGFLLPSPIRDEMESEWRYYLARPFSLFGASVWNEWYASDRIREVLGWQLDDALFVEVRPNLVRNYRKSSQLADLQISIDELLGDPSRAYPALERGLRLNREAQRKLSEGRTVLSSRKSIFSLISPCIQLLYRISCPRRRMTGLWRFVIDSV